MSEIVDWGPTYVVVERAAVFRPESQPLALQGRRGCMAGLGRLDGEGVLWQFLLPSRAFERRGPMEGSAAADVGASLWGGIGTEGQR